MYAGSIAYTALRTYKVRYIFKYEKYCGGDQTMTVRMNNDGCHIYFLLACDWNDHILV